MLGFTSVHIRLYGVQEMESMILCIIGKHYTNQTTFPANITLYSIVNEENWAKKNQVTFPSLVTVKCKNLYDLFSIFMIDYCRLFLLATMYIGKFDKSKTIYIPHFNSFF